jgi:1-acylglycerone phosphate reductase
MPVLDTDIAVAKDMFEVNLSGVIRAVQAFSPMIIAAGGKIVNTSSIVGEFPNSFTGAYNASKAALSVLTDNLRIEMEPLGVKVITVSRGVYSDSRHIGRGRSRILMLS